MKKRKYFKLKALWEQKKSSIWQSFAFLSHISNWVKISGWWFNRNNCL